MAYQKLQVGLAAKAIPSDTIDIPLASSANISSETTATTIGKLVDDTKDFTAIQGLKAGAVVVNTTDGTIATVTAIDDATTLSLSADIMAISEEYELYLNPSANLGVGCILYIPTDGNIRVKTVSGSEVTYTGVKGGADAGVFRSAIWGGESGAGVRYVDGFPIMIRCRC